MLWVELFIDKNHIIEDPDPSNLSSSPESLIIKTHQPTFDSVIFKPKNAWDNHHFSTYFNITSFKGKYYMYYRGNLPSANTNYHNENTCVLISDDGYTWTQPNVGIYSDDVVVKSQTAGKNKINTQGSRTNIPGNNNVVWKSDGISHNFYAFQNHQDPNTLYAIGGLNAASCNCCAKGIYLMSSNDGFHWEQGKRIVTPSNSLTQGYGTYYDSMNTVVWDNFRKHYRIFLRYNYNRGVRCIQTQTSTDLEKWISPDTLYYNISYPNPKTPRYYYMSNIWSHPNNGYFIGFPSGQSGDNRESQTIDLMVSRDGIHWDILENTWLGKTSVSPERMIPFVIESKSEDNYLLYVNDAKNTKVKMYKIRRDGFTSLATNIENKTISFKTHPIWLETTQLTLNYIIQSTGSLQLHINDDVTPILTLKGPVDTTKYEITLDQAYKSSYVQLQFRLTNAEIFSYSYHTNPDKITIHKYDSDSNKYTNIASSRDKSSSKDKIPKNKEIKNNENKEIKNKEIKNNENKEIFNKEIKSKEIKNKEKEEYIEKYEKDKNLELINKVLSDNPSTKIKYIYFDLIRSNSEPSERIYMSPKPIKQIINVKYSNHNNAERGDKKYGRTFQFTTIDIEDQLREVTLINNYRSNCIVEFTP
jgi:hypothetical protein